MFYCVGHGLQSGISGRWMAQIFVKMWHMEDRNGKEPDIRAKR